MKHLITFQESLKNKGINTYDIGKTNYDPEHPWRGVRKNNIKKSDYSGIMNHWRKIESPFSMKRDEKALFYQFVWTQHPIKKNSKGYKGDESWIDYPDFNYDHNIMACNLCLDRHWKKSDKWSLSLYFPSYDDDIMYRCESEFNSYEEGLSKMNLVKIEFEKAFRKAYRNRKSIKDTTIGVMSELFDIVD